MLSIPAGSRGFSCLAGAGTECRMPSKMSADVEAENGVNPVAIS